MKWLIVIILFFFYSTVNGQFKFVSWNVHMIPNATKKHARSLLINKKLLEDSTDVVLLQEAFGRKVIKTLGNNYPFSVQPHSKFLKLNSGLLILSKYPISNVQYYSFKSKQGIDRFCHKGAVMFTITVNGVEHIMVNTHLQNHYTETTENQIVELLAFAKDSHIIAGDFNYKKLQNFTTGFHVKLTDSTYDEIIIDYILTKKNLSSSVIKSDLSDHHPIYSVVE